MKILNELEYAKEIVGNKPNYKKKIKFRLIAKYFYHVKNLRGQDLEKELNEFCTKYVTYFNKVTWFKTVESWCRYVTKNSLFIVKPVKITMKEYECIKSVNSKDYEKVLFILLILTKINKQKYMLYVEDKLKYTDTEKEFTCEDYYVVETINEILKLAHVKLGSTRKKYDLMTKIMDLGLIDVNKNGKLKIEFVDEECEEDYVMIDDFDNDESWVLEYTSREYGEKVKNCESCGKLIKAKGKNNKYCKECFDKRRKEQINKNSKKYYNDNIKK